MNPTRKKKNFEKRQELELKDLCLKEKDIYYIQSLDRQKTFGKAEPASLEREKKKKKRGN